MCKGDFMQLEPTWRDTHNGENNSNLVKKNLNLNTLEKLSAGFENPNK